MKAGTWLRFSAVLLLCGGLFLGFVSAQPTEDKQPKLLKLPAGSRTWELQVPLPGVSGLDSRLPAPPLP